MSLKSALPMLAVASLLAGCGSTATAVNQGGKSAGGQVTVTDGKGQRVTLNAPAKRIVTLEWAQTEDAITLGVQPVGVADVKGFGRWDSAAKISGQPIDVGLRATPSLEAIAKAKPDVIVGVEESVPANVLGRLKQIAPVVLLKGADASNPMGKMESNFRAVATLLGKQDKANTVLASMNSYLGTLRTKVQATPAGKRPYVLAYPNAQGNTVDFRMHATGSLPGAVAQRLGLVNAWKGKGDPVWGVGSSDLEGLSTLPANTTFLYWGSSESDPVKTVLPKSAAWTGLPFVKSGQVVRTADGVWLYGGPASVRQWADRLVADLATA
ncbi:iron-siderophore ABC transporter substrate-binding protein [Calidifontibacter sp. DB0510]|uniref:Iron-siderophore ABC transporter substrate-binding protein n=1 Tax=Metallococcus carri TaxID=1656884 RepID=A0A967B1K1_9MICO|nr:iron-siderophore ABC transporter substrate-binding protein [Metallococcus carri]NHN56603.1 iron-siderophore ABC transporter substrate-binding protein [Metallococcus carri]NOP38902.1 iron-siderophore ABC transporter substrate-binding protein [Calidifontibacter sp. DB2511S]